MSIRKGSSIIAGNIGQNVDSALSPTSDNPVKNSVLTEAFADTVSTKNITNCITKIPQNIKLELSGTTLTLKAGSKFYYPNGLEYANPVFSSFTTTADLVLNVGGSGWTAEPHFITVLNDGTASLGYAAQDVYSGDNAPASMSSQYGLWYDTSSNIIRRTTDTGSTWTSTPYSFPICIAENTGGTCSGIIQTFNGMGFIGNVFFALPGLVGLMPNRRNIDGSLLNTEVELTTPIIRAVGGSTDTLATITYSANNPTIPGILWDNNNLAKYIYDFENNWYYTTEAPEYQRLKLARIRGNGTRILEISQNYNFKALDYNDREYISHQAMPSNRYIDFTMGATGTLYTAPADGFIYIRRFASTANKYVAIIKYLEGNIAYEASVMWSVSAGDQYVNAQVSKGEKFAVTYNSEGGGGSEFFRFIYSNGSI